jgi:hypothetical protein
MLMIRSASAASLLTIGLWANVAGAETGSPPIPNFDVRAACNSLQKVPEALSVNADEPDAPQALRRCGARGHAINQTWSGLSLALLIENCASGNPSRGAPPHRTPNWKVACK